LPQPPTIKRYDCLTSALDIASVYYDAFTLNTVVDHPDKQERQRIKAVVTHAANLLGNTTDDKLQDINRRLQVPPLPMSSPEWSSWNSGHLQAALELKDVVVKLLQPAGESSKVQFKSTVCAVGSRLLKLNAKKK